MHMDKHYINSLIACLLIAIPAISFAEPPAAQEADEPVVIENQPATTDMRPAARESMPETSPAMTETRTEQKTSGDVLHMAPMQAPGEAVAQPVRQLDFPRRGMSQSKVQNELGRPVEIIPAVGEPPISRWVYDDRVVYFEYASVVHVVAK